MRRSIDRSGGSVAALEAAISLMAALTPLATSRAEGCGRWAAGIAEMAEEAMKDAVAGKVRNFPLSLPSRSLWTFCYLAKPG